MLIKKASTAYPLVFFMTDSTDHITGKTGLSPTVTLSKAGGSFASPSGSVSEIANGWYKVAGNATDTGTDGALALHASATGADPTDMLFEVVEFDPQDAVHLGLSAVPNVAAGATGGLPTSADSSGRVDITQSAADKVWSTTTRALTSFGTLIADIWSAATRALTDKVGFALTSAYDAAKTAAQAGDAMTLTSGERTSIATAVWGATTRTLSSFGTLIADIWGYSTRSLTDKADFFISGTKTTLDALNDITAASVWAVATRTLTSFGTLAADVWAVATRTLTSYGTLTADTATAVWGAATRTLTSFGTLASDVWGVATRTLTSYGTLTADTATAVWGASVRSLTTFGTLVADIWGYSTRTLTSFGTLVADTATAVWAESVRTLSSFGTLVSDIWSAATRALTDKLGFQISGTKTKLDDLNDITAASVWAVSTRTLTSYGTLVADVATAVWGAGTRTLSSFGTLISDIWSYITRTLTGTASDGFASGQLFVDSSSGISGTAYPNGTALYPVNNINDAIAIARANKLISINIVLHTQIDLDGLDSGSWLEFHGTLGQGGASLFVDQVTMIGSKFEDMVVATDGTGTPCKFQGCSFLRSWFGNNIQLAGCIVRDGGFNGTGIQIQISGLITQFIETKFTGSGVILVIEENVDVFLTNCTGIVTVASVPLGYTKKIRIDNFEGTLLFGLGTIMNPCDVLITGGAGQIVDNSLGGANIVTTGFFPNSTPAGTTPAAVWAYSSRTLTSFGTLVADMATAVWSAGTRTLTSVGTLVADVATAVWSASGRTLDSFGTLIADIWLNATRSLTDKLGFSLTSAYDAAKTAAQDATVAKDADIQKLLLQGFGRLEFDLVTSKAYIWSLAPTPVRKYQATLTDNGGAPVTVSTIGPINVSEWTLI